MRGVPLSLSLSFSLSLFLSLSPFIVLINVSSISTSNKVKQTSIFRGLCAICYHFYTATRTRTVLLEQSYLELSACGKGNADDADSATHVRHQQEQSDLIKIQKQIYHFHLCNAQIKHIKTSYKLLLFYLVVVVDPSFHSSSSLNPIVQLWWCSRLPIYPVGGGVTCFVSPRIRPCFFLQVYVHFYFNPS